MIDRAARDQLASLVRRFGIGNITNREFEAGVPASADRAISAVEDYVWCFYDDFLKHRMTGDWALSYGIRRDFARTILFLKTDQEFNRPSRAPRFTTVAARWIAWATAGLWHPSIDNRQKPGDQRVWPFYSRENYQRALKQRHYLSGRMPARS